MAFVIVSAGTGAVSRPRTVGSRPLLLGGGLAVLALMATCVAGGYLAGRRADTTAESDVGAPAAPLDHAERRVLVEHVGSLAGRVTRVESEAAALAKRLGLPAATPDPASDAPSGGPLVPLAATAAFAPATAALGDDGGTGIAQLERDLERLEAELADMNEAAAEHDLATMALPNRLPVLGRKVASGFGTRRDPFTGRLARHTGLDIPAPRGTPILASGGGRVRLAGFNGAYGYTVIIDHGGGLATLYGHASKLFVRAGDIVMPNQKIAAVGSTGRSTGPHLHFEVIRNGRRVAPEQYLAGVLARKRPS
jgi:murein DD-endopeptidase MepM/ murein hydrolase activator NlpD